MTSNNSTYKMIREHPRHSAWMLGLSAIGSLLFGPIMFLFAHGGNNYERYRLNHTAEEFAQYVSQNVISDLGYCTTMLLIIATAGAAIVAFGIFSYLFQPRKIDLYHSLPVTRKELFWSSYLTGLLIWVIPFAVGAVFTFASAFVILEDFTMFGAVLFSMLQYLLYPAFGFFVVYHLCLVGVMLSGNIANAMVSTCVWGLSVIIIQAILTMYASAFFDTFYDPGNSYFITYALSPLATPFVLVGYSGSTDWGYLAMVIISVVIAGANLFIAYKLHKVRKSELAGHGMDNKFASLSIRVCIAIILGLLGVVPMYLFGYDMQSRPMWMLLFNTLFAAIAYAVATAIQKRSLKAFFAHKIQLVIVTACSVLIAVIYVFDVFGYDAYLPSEGSIESMEIDIHGFKNYVYYDGFEGYKITDSTLINDVLTAATDTSSSGYHSSVTVKVSPKFGFDYYRRYSLSQDDIEILRPIVETQDYVAYRLKELVNSQNEINSIHVYAVHSSNDIDDQTNVTNIIDAYLKDCYQLTSLEQQAEYLTVATIAFRHYTKEADGGGSYNYIMEVPITANHVNTIKALRAANDRIILTKDQLEVKSVTVYRHSSNLSLLDYLYKDLLPADMLDFDEAYAEEYGIKTSDILKEGAVVIQTTSGYETNDYSHTFVDEELEWLMPYLYFAQSCHDGFGFDNYAYIGQATVQYNNSMDVYIKRGDMTVEEIQKLASFLEIEEYY